MLQPSQLEDVSVRYADEIAEVREFFRTAGVAVESPQALPQVVAGLREDRAFHRDLTSHVWVMLHRRGAGVRYGETLGVLAVAAAGKQLATQADEAVAHDLLRFVMETHDRLSAPARSAAPVAAKPVAPVIPMRPVHEVTEPPVVLPEPVAAVPEVESEPVVEPKATEHASMQSRMLVPTLVRPTLVAENDKESERPVMETPIRLSHGPAETDEPKRRGKGLVWLALVAVLLCVFAAGWWMHLSKPADETAAAPVVEGTNAVPVEPPPAVIAAPEQPVATTPVTKPPAIPGNQTHTRAAEAPHGHPQPYKPQLVPSYPQAVIVARSAAPPATSSSVASNARSAAIAPPPAATTPAPIVRSTAPAAKAGPRTVGNDVLSKQLDHPGLTKEQEAEYDATGRRYPRLLRRTPAGNGNSQFAANTMPTMPGMANGTPSVGAAAAGVVRPTSLGVMASNLVYSPAASYPAAASAAHVTGAVKVEAVVDTSGNVAAARVISGPAQLRDAALMAVQQWRYKPYVLGGKARTFTTQALMEFELP
ncbi:MAG: TonB family protein [Terriglobus sp.]